MHCDGLQNSAKPKNGTQNPPRATSWGFDPPSRHQQNENWGLVYRLQYDIKASTDVRRSAHEE